MMTLADRLTAEVDRNIDLFKTDEKYDFKLTDILRSANGPC